MLLTGKHIPGIFLEFILTLVLVMLLYLVFSVLFIVFPLYLVAIIMAFFLLPVVGLVYRVHAVKRMEFVSKLSGGQLPPLFKKIN